MPYPTCNFIKYDDVLCGSPALRGQDYCYHHTRQLHDAYYGARALARGEACRIQLFVIAAATPASASSPTGQDAVNQEVA
jgi:hypothetical protein